MMHPNASITAVVGGLATLLVWALKHWGVDVNAEQAAGIATAATALVLFVGRKGIKQTILDVWRGTQKPTAKK